MNVFLDTFKELNTLYTSLDSIASCHYMKTWAESANQKTCSDSINKEFYLLFVLGAAILGLIVLGVGVYLSENIIRGIYNEEIQYVKTNKLRFDWN